MQQLHIRYLSRARHGSRALVRGFTAIELMVTVAILAVLAALAAPSFTSIIERWRVRDTVESMTSTLYYARSEAIKRGGGVVVRKLTNTTGGCQNAGTTEEWGCGWIVFVDLNGNGTYQQATETMLREIPLSGSVNVIKKPSGATFKIDRFGMADGNNTLSFVLSPTPDGVSSPHVTTLCIAAGGRIRAAPGEIDCKKQP